jgi:hypothetical protein
MRPNKYGFVLLISALAVAHAQQTNPLDVIKLSDSLTHMESHDLLVREDAFADLMAKMKSDVGDETASSNPGEILNRFLSRHPDQADRVKVSMIQLLTTENETFLGKNVKPGTYTEKDTEHYANVIDTVSSLNDERAIPALVGAITTGGMAQRGLVKYGGKALDLVLAAFKSGESQTRSAALGTAVTILRSSIDAASHVQAAALLGSSLKDADFVVREEAVMLVDCANDRQDFVPILEQLANTDSTRYPGGTDDGTDGNWHYPVRVQARRVLRDIQNNKNCNTHPTNGGVTR